MPTGGRILKFSPSVMAAENIICEKNSISIEQSLILAE